VDAVAGGGQWTADQAAVEAQAPLDEYRAILGCIADQRAGGQGVNSTPACLPPGMPRVMIVYEPMEIVITPETTTSIESCNNCVAPIPMDATGRRRRAVLRGLFDRQMEDEDGDGRSTRS
jgi:hypothetical protein